MNDARSSLEAWCRFLYYCVFMEESDALWVVPSSSSEGGFRFRMQSEDAYAEGYITRDCALSVEPGYLRHVFDRMVAVSTLLGARRAHLTAVEVGGSSRIHGSCGVIIARGASGTLALAADTPLASPPSWSSFDVTLSLVAPPRRGLVVSLPEDDSGGIAARVRASKGSPQRVQLSGRGQLLYARLAPEVGTELAVASHGVRGSSVQFSARVMSVRWVRRGEDAWPVLVLAPSSSPRLVHDGACLADRRGAWVRTGERLGVVFDGFFGKKCGILPSNAVAPS